MEKLVAGYRYLADLYAKGIEVSGEEGDDCTQDIFIANKTDIEKIFGCYKPNLAKRLVLTHNLKQLPKPLTLTLAVFLFKGTKISENLFSESAEKH